MQASVLHGDSVLWVVVVVSASPVDSSAQLRRLPPDDDSEGEDKFSSWYFSWRNAFSTCRRAGFGGDPWAVARNHSCSAFAPESSWSPAAGNSRLAAGSWDPTAGSSGPPAGS